MRRHSGSVPKTAARVILLPGPERLEDRAVPATFTVTNLGDAPVLGAGDAPGTLRQAVFDANVAPGADVIVFQAGLTGTITLTDGELFVLDSVHVAGPGADLVTLSGGDATRLFNVENTGGTIGVTISGLTLTRGAVVGIGGAVRNFDENLTLDGVVISASKASATSTFTAGGGVASEGGTLTVRNSVVTGNRAEVLGEFATGGHGGGIFAGGDTTLTVEGSTVSGNLASEDGGGLFAGTGATATVRGSTISGNTAGDDGGGAAAAAGTTLHVRDSTLSGNRAGTAGFGSGGGAHAVGRSLTVENSTVSGNSATDSGGGIFSAAGTLTLRNSTVAFNQVTAGGTGGGGVAVGGGAAALESTIAGGNTAPSGPDVLGTALVTFSLIGNTAGLTAAAGSGNNKLNADALLGPLALNGGSTATHALLPGSPATDAGSNPAGLATDQRGPGFPRVIGPRADIGAFERDSIPPSVTVGLAPGQPALAAALPINFLVVFSEPVAGFAASDVVRGGTAAGGTVAAAETGPMNGTTFLVSVAGLTSAGTVTVAVPAGAAADGAGNPSLASAGGPAVTFAPGLSLGDLVWNDLNGDGVRQGHEPGLAGIGVRLFADADGNGVPDGGALAATVTAADGTYRFAGLGAGNYLVEIDLPAGFRSSPGVARSHEPAPGPNNDVDNDDNGTRFGGVVRSGTVTLAPFAEPANDGDGDVSTNLTVDFGLAPRLDQNEVGPFAVGAGPGGPTQVEYRNPDQMVAFAVDAFPGFAGGVRTAVADVNGDGVPDLVAGTGPGGPTRVRVFDGQTRQEIFAADPFEPSFVGGVFVAAGDINADGRAEVIVSPDLGGGPRVRVFSGTDFAVLADFFGIEDPFFRGGARVAAGDVNADGLTDLLVAAGFGGGPRLAAFDGRRLFDPVEPGQLPPKLFGDIFVFEDALRNGVFVTAADLDGDGFAEVVAGGGPGGGPRVQAFSGRALALSGEKRQVANFFGGDVGNRGGIRPAGKDLDGDGRDDLIVGAGEGAGSRVTAYLGKDIPEEGDPAAVFFGFDGFPGFANGVFVG